MKPDVSPSYHPHTDSPVRYQPRGEDGNILPPAWLLQNEATARRVAAEEEAALNSPRRLAWLIEHANEHQLPPWQRRR